MCYTPSCHTSGIGAFCFFKQRHCGQSEYLFWAKRPVLSDSRPAACVTAVADSTGRFAMTKKNGKPCKNCGQSEWYENGQCVPCTSARGKEYYRRNKSKVSKRHQKWAQQNKESSKERSKRYRLNHPGRANEISRQWAKRNPEKTTAFYHKYRTERTNGGGAYSAAEWNAVLKRYGNKCLCCGRTDVKLTADHIIPVSKGGSSNIDNLQPLCQTCNSKKRDKTIDYRPDKGKGRWVQKRLFE